MYSYSGEINRYIIVIKNKSKNAGDIIGSCVEIIIRVLR
jgi:hypothetical protein